MANGMPITVCGTIAKDPERWRGNGKVAARFIVQTTIPARDTQTHECIDDYLSWVCIAYGQPAADVAKSLKAGMKVIVTGGLERRIYKTQAGETQRITVVVVENVGLTLGPGEAKAQNRARRERGGGS